MTLMRRPTPLTELMSFRDVVDRLFDERYWRPLLVGETERELMPPLDVYTTADSVVAKVALPGVKPEDVDIQIAQEMVTISGTFEEQTEATENGFLHKELSRGSFRRSVRPPVPFKADEAKATFKDGLLTLTLPKAERALPTHVKVEVV